MQTITYNEVLNNLPFIMDNIQEEPVTIQKSGASAAVLLSYEEYERLVNVPIVNFQNICDDIGRKAETRGLTEEKLAEILK